MSLFINMVLAYLIVGAIFSIPVIIIDKIKHPEDRPHSVYECFTMLVLFALTLPLWPIHAHYTFTHKDFKL